VSGGNRTKAQVGNQERSAIGGLHADRSVHLSIRHQNVRLRRSRNGVNAHDERGGAMNLPHSNEIGRSESEGRRKFSPPLHVHRQLPRPRRIEVSSVS
jgi:hypothetical protein